MNDIEDRLHAMVTVPNKGISLGLERITQLLEKLGNPHLRLPPIIHVAGTNGKGSTVAFLRAMLEAAELRAHAYTSPHLIKFNERIRLAGELVTDEQLLAVFDEIEVANAGGPITFFEITTVAAFLLFARMPADAVLLEVGLGGRLDATNVITPAVSVITRISMDHMEFLGDTLEKIAAEKAGIIKPGVPVVVGYQAQESVYAVFRARAAAVGAPLVEYDKDFSTEELPDGFTYFPLPLTPSRKGRGNSSRLCGKTPSPLAGEGWGGGVKYPSPALLGAHQILNASAAITAVKTFSCLMPHASRLMDEHIREGLCSVEWPGRLQRITSGPLAAMLSEHCELWYDGAHNDSGAAALAEQCRRWCAAGYEIHLVLGMLKTKNPAAFAPVMAQAHTITAIGMDSDQPAYAPNELAERLKGVTNQAIKSVATLRDAVNPNILAQQKELYLVSGSLFLAKLIFG